MLNRWIAVLIGLLWTISLTAQGLPRCGNRAFIVQQPLVDPTLWCIERPLEVNAGELAVTALTVTADGTLYALRPLAGELYALRDSDGDRLPDTPELVASGMHLPAGMSAAGNTLYILGDGMLYRYQDGDLQTLLDDLPGGRGFMASGIAVHEERVYIGIPMPCDFCAGDHPLHGTIISYDLQRGEQVIEARGLRYPAALAFYEGRLWVGDTARDGLYTERESLYAWRNLDELNAFDPADAAVPHFGFPYCIGADNQPDLAGEFDCEQAVPPLLVSATQSTPYALVPYSSPTFPHLTGDLLLVLAGSVDDSQIRGHQLVALDMTRADGRIQTETIFPAAPAFTFKTVNFYDETGVISNDHAEAVNRSGNGPWTHRIYGLAVSAEGWLFISVGGGSLYVLRPGDHDPCSVRDC